MRIDRTVPEAQRTGVSVYYDDYKKRLSVDVSKQSPTSAYRKNRPHPPKNFLEPHRSLSDPNLQFQHQLRKSVRKYVDELYNNAEGNIPNGEYISQAKFRPERPDTSTPVYHRKSPQYYPCNQTLNISAPPLHITGYNCTRQPAESIRAEINPRLQGESKRERSVRITDEIRENTKLQTPEPQRLTWQAPRSPQPKHLQPHWASPNKSKKRISSAPPGTNGFTHYNQHQSRPNMEKYNDDMVANVEKWANTASNYEKQVIFKMLKQVSPNSGAPSTPMSFGNAGVPQSGGFHPYELPNEGDYYPELTNYSKPKKHRNLHSAPIKRMGGLVAHSTQHPTRDQRVYRLKGQDTRIDPSPQEERSLNGYMNQLQNRQLSYSKRDRKYARVPMHTHLPRQTTGAQDYQCKVSFFQSVRSPFKNHFVIHPDFTSESMTKRKPVSHTITHFRY